MVSPFCACFALLIFDYPDVDSVNGGVKKRNDGAPIWRSKQLIGA
jgi:hypothetical protein